MTLVSRAYRSGMVKYSVPVPVPVPVPVRFTGRKVRVSLRANEVVVFGGRTPIAVHPRIAARAGTSVQLDHYLEVLKIKPGAFPGSNALAAARASGAFPSVHEAFWATARRDNGDAAGTRELIDVLLLHRSMTEADVIAGMTAALQVGAVSADVVALEARRHASRGGAHSGRHRPAHTVVSEHRVVSLTQRRLADPAAVIAGLPTDTRPLPSVGAYDELLARRAHSECTLPATTPTTTSEESHVS
ncbi:transposase [Mycolicibacterium conceptionense]|uniref:Transposase n=1 Tax=Mycolicibacterium conceptionense TaxID=451644 RepID=A0A0U1CYB3_9MYCO|nr:transposase [Mycolicibacterium conceptionense]